MMTSNSLNGASSPRHDNIMAEFEEVERQIEREKILRDQKEKIMRILDEALEKILREVSRKA
ncbi:hypothetical protein GGD66_006574 [Bradyrhizobium sp. CIR48]|uniref:hypothetical protein n=1 Tax=unclassified Bradyrhizobium TaxID=2631580 RepID=UPI0015C8012F|nr:MULTISPECIES: hypothetical protein [unclassified Bradyrhizobium]MBB4427988.1 hypothetical protein [Bradyrhizobium sp. CIR48]NYG49883.1 hypothetical protein [Bradyrhizobium sp. IAR9]